MDEKKLHTQEFQLKGSSRNMRCKLLQKRFTGKRTVHSKHLHDIAIEEDILSELNRYIFQISLKFIKLVIPKILFILVLCSFNFYFKIMWPPKQNYPTPLNNIYFWPPPPPPSKDFSKIFNPPPPSWRGGGCIPYSLSTSITELLFLSKFNNSSPFVTWDKEIFHVIMS